MASAMTRRGRSASLLVAAAIAILILAALQSTAMASTNCGAVTNTAGNRMRVKVVRGSVSCATARSLGRRARLYGPGDGVAGWACYHTDYTGQSRGWWGGCTRRGKEVRFYKP
jgi:hypothetical protein